MPYYLTYDVERHPGGISKEAIPDGHGAADALVLGSVVDGSAAVASVDGRTGEDAGAVDIYLVFAGLAHGLSEDERLDPVARLVPKLTHAFVRAFVLSSRLPPSDLGPFVERLRAAISGVSDLNMEMAEVLARAAVNGEEH